MDTSVTEESFAKVLEIVSPESLRLPLVLASPHSGTVYPPSFLAASALAPHDLRRSEDSHVDELFAAGPRLGAPLLRALFPRAYLDVNREPWELDPAMFDGPLPPYVNQESPRVAAGLGTIARMVASGAEIYRGKLSFEDAKRRVETLYRPYHAALLGLIDQSVSAFGCCLLLDCHSMPSVGGLGESDPGNARVDVVLGDCFGSSCAPVVVRCAEQSLRHSGYRVVRNTPYAGGYTTRHYGKPLRNVHVLQIEVNRRLYMDEASHAPHAGFPVLQEHLAQLLATLADISLSVLKH